jgi:hypothetical protein
VSGGLRGNDVGYLEALFDAFETIEAPVTPFDFLGVEPFNGGASPDVNDPGEVYEQEPFGVVDGNFLGYQQLHNVLRAYGESQPIYITLFGYTTEDHGRGSVPDDVRASYLKAAFELTTCDPYVGVFTWYAFHPNPWDDASWTLLDKFGQPNLTYDALVAWSKAAA